MDPENSLLSLVIHKACGWSACLLAGTADETMFLPEDKQLKFGVLGHMGFTLVFSLFSFFFSCCL